jgi:hypothetical protein
MEFLRIKLLVLFTAILGTSCNHEIKHKEVFNFNDLKIRLAEIEIDSVYFDEYISSKSHPNEKTGPLILSRCR